MRPTPQHLIVLVASLVLAAAACGGDDGEPSAAPSTTADQTPASTAPPAPIEAGSVATTSPHDEGSPYVTQSFVLPFDVAVPGWLPDAASVDWPNFVTWESTSPQDPAVRFLVPVNVYPPGTNTSTAPPKDYLAYLLAQADHGATLADVSDTTVGGMPATLMTATTTEHLEGSLGCQAEALTAHECFGLQPDLTLRIAVIDTGDMPLVAWLRHDNVAGTGDTTDEFASFEEMLASVQFHDRNVGSTAASSVPDATPIDGVWTTTITFDELASSPLLYPGGGELNDGNWGDWTFTFDAGQFTVTQENPKTASSLSGTYRVEGDNVALTNEFGEHFVMRWSVDGDELTFERDESLGIAPTPFIIHPWSREQ